MFTDSGANEPEVFSTYRVGKSPFGFHKPPRRAALASASTLRHISKATLVLVRERGGRASSGWTAPSTSVTFCLFTSAGAISETAKLARVGILGNAQQ